MLSPFIVLLPILTPPLLLFDPCVVAVDCCFSFKMCCAVAVTATCVASADIADTDVAPCCHHQLIVYLTLPNISPPPLLLLLGLPLVHCCLLNNFYLLSHCWCSQQHFPMLTRSPMLLPLYLPLVDCFNLNFVSSHWFAVVVTASCAATTVLSTITTGPYAIAITSV